jgi:hypothetical protein
MAGGVGEGVLFGLRAFEEVAFLGEVQEDDAGATCRNTVYGRVFAYGPIGAYAGLTTCI